MFRFYTIIFFILYFTLSISNDQNKSSINLNENNITYNISRKKAHQKLLNEHLKIMISIGSISVGIMIIIVSIYIAKQYFGNPIKNKPEIIEQRILLNRRK